METINFKKPTFKKTRINNFPRSFKAISPVIATLLMITIVVVASLVVYAWVNGYMGFQTSKTGKAIDIPSVALASDGLHVYVQNVGQSDVTLGAVYVNGEQKNFTPDPNYSTNVLPIGETANILVDSSYADSAKLNIKVTTTDGTFMTKTETVTTGSENPNPTNSADNTSPILSAISDQTVDELSELSFTATATDSDLPANTLTYSLINAPSGASVDPNSGVFTWIPTAAQGPGDYSFTVRVTDNGSPTMYAEQTVNVHVNEVDSTPQTITLRPNAAGSSTHLDSQGTSPNYSCVNEVPDNTNYYVRGTSSDNWQQDSYNIPDQTLSGNINCVTVHIIVQKSGSSTDSHLDAYSIIRLNGGTMKTGQSHDLTSTWTEYSDSYTTKPTELGGGAWTWNDINALQIGVGLRSHDAGWGWWHDWTYARCTQVWVEINYTN